ncbi:MAG TPA: dihydroneopterin aldolase [bacterium]|nr:dihydroneopterin aldolase [bacterium]HQL63853.1 dihydroneopterin aldolase [bacterium]
MDRIVIENIEISGCHGYLEQEKRTAQPFRVDVTLMGHFSVAAQTDSLDETVDYRRVFEIVKRVMTGESVNLLETLAGRIAEELSTVQRVEHVRVRVTKLAPPIPDFRGTVAVEVERTGLG